ncbi:MAG TPA: NACHT domain-containing protein [Cyclobacteriaceae bacterium]|nr:NACHT domain-containing protein [Cyclobacteriaceae bacterium]HMV07425.1 NACHT domain-containing protein [Cyclobacteriaceae bacterium]HMV88971.1 NACHT domain-containing protein [Cyclobacteriaceae bacterium]HMX48991.1 NACHT domain-containing protein [Cyclobacteriaceae bacterium]HMY94952.1 NACHT domain-containing protein [Cyclobacteriaceae bacterium]
MAISNKAVDKVRASRDGHQFHETWAAGRTLELLLPKDSLLAIAVEGISPTDSSEASSDLTEIADLTLYYGIGHNFDVASRIAIVQFKYSIGSASKPYRVTDARKTLNKFASSFKSLIRQHGTDAVTDKVTFEIITNRPIASEFIQAVELLGFGKRITDRKLKSIADQIKSATKLTGTQLKIFTGKLQLTGTAGSLEKNSIQLRHTIVNWSLQAVDARARLGDLKDLVRKKAGSAGEHNNLITREDLLEVLSLADETALLPCPESFPVVPHVVAREQLDEIVTRVPALTKPLIIHASGGVGKTVFLQSLASRLAEHHEVVLFDCFGGGAYRAFEDNRHHVKRGLLHIVNKLACAGLCDLILPGSADTQDVFSAARSRLEQAASAIQRTAPGRKLVLLLDAIDNAATIAEQKKDDAFPTLLLESITFGGSIPDLCIVASTRTERKDKAIRQAACESLLLRPFSKAETTLYIKSHIPSITDSEIDVAFSRSNGIGRVLEHLIADPDNLLAPSGLNQTIELDELLQAKIDAAIQESLLRGHSQQTIDTFLAGLSVLPLPIPVAEYANALGLPPSEVDSFTVDLYPLLEQTSYGLMFRDEPTDTLMRTRYGSQLANLTSLVTNLRTAQSTSEYAARALPSLLVTLDDAPALVALAFSTDFPATIKSKVGKQNVRYSRVMAALKHCILQKKYNEVLSLVVELSTVAAGNSRVAEYILANPELIIASNDSDSKRRLFEIKTSWQGTRHSRLAVAHFLAGETGDAFPHVVKSSRWMEHYFRQPDEERFRNREGRPDHIDIAVTPLGLIYQHRYKVAFRFIDSRWKKWYAFNVAEYCFGTVATANALNPGTHDVKKILAALPLSIPVCAAALQLNLPAALQKAIVVKLAKACQAKPDTLKERELGHEVPNIVMGLLDAAGIAIQHKQLKQAKSICAATPIEVPSNWTFTRSYWDNRIAVFVLHACLAKTAAGKNPGVIDFLSKDLVGIVPPDADLTPETYRSKIKEYIAAHAKLVNERERKSEDKTKRYTYEDQKSSEQFVDNHLGFLLEVSNVFTSLLSASTRTVGKRLDAFIKFWREGAKVKTNYGTWDEGFAEPLCRDLFLYILHTRKDLPVSVGGQVMQLINEDKLKTTRNLIAIVSRFAQQDIFHSFAGEIAIKVAAKIENQNNVDDRSRLYADLAKAIMPASKQEMAAYFHKGLEQVELIGSGDYNYARSLLTFAGGVKGKTLENRDFHTLSNLAELNLDESDKFPWYQFGLGMSNVGGLNVLAKISRWDDRDKVSLTYTLLPCLIGLMKHKKIEARHALVLIHLSVAYGAQDWDFVSLAEEIFAEAKTNTEELMDAVLLKFEKDSHDLAYESSIKSLKQLVDRAKGSSSPESKRLAGILVAATESRAEKNEPAMRSVRKARENSPFHVTHKKLIAELLRETDPTNTEQLANAFRTLHEAGSFYGNDVELFFEKLRFKVAYGDRGKYIATVASFPEKIHVKLKELDTCQELWRNSSTGLQAVLKSHAPSLVSNHISDLIHYDLTYLDEKDLNELSRITGTSMQDVIIQLITSLINGGHSLDGSLWLAIASMLAPDIDGETTQAALVRLLRGETATLSASVGDGTYHENLYPSTDEADIVATFIWKQLGSENSISRWRAAHSVRMLVKLDCISVLDALIEKLNSQKAGGLQANELPFFHLHAKLWLSIALARIAVDRPDIITRHLTVLQEAAMSTKHVSMRHFIGQAILHALPDTLTEEQQKLKQQLDHVNISQHEPIDEETAEARLALLPKSSASQEFFMDWDFEKYFITPLAEVFGLRSTTVEHRVAERVKQYDPNVESMFENGGRNVSHDKTDGMSPLVHRYGYYLCWHAIQEVAGELLQEYPIVIDQFTEDSWNNWLSAFMLTRVDGLWLADGTDLYPIEVRGHLLDRKGKNLIVTGNPDKLRAIAGVDGTKITKRLVVSGQWKSGDGIDVRVSSALLPRRGSTAFSKKLAGLKPYRAWLASFEESQGHEYSHHRSKDLDYTPWITVPGGEAGLDENDPYGVRTADRRRKLSESFRANYRLTKGDPFGKNWINSKNTLIAESEAWGVKSYHRDRNEESSRLSLIPEFLKEVLTTEKKNLVVLIKLERYEPHSRYDYKPSKHTNTTAVLHIDSNLKITYLPGPVNKEH